MLLMIDLSDWPVGFPLQEVTMSDDPGWEEEVPPEVEKALKEGIPDEPPEPSEKLKKIIRSGGNGS